MHLIIIIFIKRATSHSFQYRITSEKTRVRKCDQIKRRKTLLLEWWATFIIIIAYYLSILLLELHKYCLGLTIDADFKFPGKIDNGAKRYFLISSSCGGFVIREIEVNRDTLSAAYNSHLPYAVPTWGYEKQLQQSCSNCKRKLQGYGWTKDLLSHVGGW